MSVFLPSRRLDLDFRYDEADVWGSCKVRTGRCQSFSAYGFGCFVGIPLPNAIRFDGGTLPDLERNMIDLCRFIPVFEGM